MKLKYNFMVNEIGDDFVAVPVGECVIDYNGIIKLNETAAFIVDKLNNDISLDDLVLAVTEKFACGKDCALENVECIVSGLKDAGLIVE